MFQQKVKYLSAAVILLSALTVSASNVSSFLSDLFSNRFAANFAPTATKTWDGGGATNNWSEGANWSGDTVPSSGDDVIFDATSTKNATIDVAVNIGSIRIANGYTGTITQAGNITLTPCNGRPCFLQDGGTFNAGANSITMTSGGFDGLRMTGGTFNGGSGDITILNGPSLSANLSLQGGTFKSTSGTLSLKGSITVQNGTAFLHNNGTVNLTSEQQNNILLGQQNPVITFNNVNFNLADGVNFNVPPRMIVLGNLALNDGFLPVLGNVIEARGAVTISPNFDGANSTLEFANGAPGRTHTFAVGLNLPKIIIDDPNITVNTSGSGTLIFHQLTLNQGIFNQGNVDLQINGPNNNGDTCFIQNGGTFNGSANLITFNDSGFGTITMNGGTFNGGSGDIISTGIRSIDDHRIRIFGGAFNSTTGTLFSGGSLAAQSPGVFHDNGGTVEFNGGGVVSFIVATDIQGNGQAIIFHNLRINKDDGNLLDTGLQGIFVTGNLSLIDGRMGDGGGGMRFIDVAGNANIASTFDGLTSHFTLRFSGSACQTITLGGTPSFPGIWDISKSGCALTVAGDYTLNTLIISNGNVIINAGSHSTVSGNLMINPAGNVTVGDNSVININDSTTISGTLDLSGSNGSVDINAGANITSSGTLDISGLNNTFNAGAGAISGSVDISGLSNTLNFDSLTIDPGGELTADAPEIITFGGDVVNNGLVNLRGFGSECAPFAGTYVTLQSSAPGTRRNWSGSGVFRMVHTNVSDMGGTAQIEAHNSVDSGNNDTNWHFDSVCQPRILHTAFDFDGDGKSDVAMFRPSAGIWFLNRSTLGISGFQWGISSDKITPADFDGDGVTDIAVWREAAQSTFFILNSSDSTVRTEDFGVTGDDPKIVGDFDGDGRADPAVYRQGTAQNPQSFFYFRGSKNNPNQNITFIPWGRNLDKALRGDFDGDGKQDAAIYRPADGNWWILSSSNPANPIVTHWGVSGDKTVEGDYDGDGKSDIAVFRPTDQTWYILQSSNNQPRFEVFGASSDIPTPGDYDGDGKTDISIFRDGQNWIERSSDGTIAVPEFGLAGDIPAASAFNGNL